MQIRYCESCGTKLPEMDTPTTRGAMQFCEACRTKATQASGASAQVLVQPTVRKSSSVRLAAVSASHQVETEKPSCRTPVGGTPSLVPPSDAATLQTPSRPPDPAGASPKVSMGFYFCEKCGKRVTEADLQAGRGRDKQLRGVFCASCAPGAQTMAFDALSQAEIWQEEQKRRGRRPAATSARLHQVHIRRSRYSAAVVGAVVVGAGALGLLVLAGAWSLGRSGNRNGSPGNRGPQPVASAAPTASGPDGNTPSDTQQRTHDLETATSMSFELAPGVKMEFVLVKPGAFEMGSNDGRPAEKPVRKVTISKPYWIGKYEVTVAQWKAFAKSTQYCTTAEKNKGGFSFRTGEWKSETGINWRMPGFTLDDNHPACLISWNDAQAFCEWATKVAQAQGVRGEVRLPTEAQWEYAARGPGSRTYPWGDRWEGVPANVADASLKAAASNPELIKRLNGIEEDDGFPYSSPVGQYPNGASWCGAFDMAGNVWEWVEDRFDRTYYVQGPSVDPPGPGAGDQRVLRGGCWKESPSGCRSWCRHSIAPSAVFMQ